MHRQASPTRHPPVQRQTFIYGSRCVALLLEANLAMAKQGCPLFRAERLDTNKTMTAYS